MGEVSIYKTFDFLTMSKVVPTWCTQSQSLQMRPNTLNTVNVFTVYLAAGRFVWCVGGLWWVFRFSIILKVR